MSAKQAHCKPWSQQTAGTGETWRAVLAPLACPAGGQHQNDSSPSQAQHKRTMLLQLEFLRLETILVCVTKHWLPQSYSLTWCEMVQLSVLRNGRLNFSPSWLCNQNGPSCSQWNGWGTYTCWKMGLCSYFLLIRKVLIKVFLSSGENEGEAFLMPFRSVWWLSHSLDALTDIDLSIAIAQFNSETRIHAFNVPGHLKSTWFFQRGHFSFFSMLFIWKKKK